MSVRYQRSVGPRRRLSCAVGSGLGTCREVVFLEGFLDGAGVSPCHALFRGGQLHDGIHRCLVLAIWVLQCGPSLFYGGCPVVGLISILGSAGLARHSFFGGVGGKPTTQGKRNKLPCWRAWSVLVGGVNRKEPNDLSAVEAVGRGQPHGASVREG